MISLKHACHVRNFATSVRRLTETRTPRVILSGIQPTGVPHLGNYLGALSNWVSLQKSAKPEDTLLYSVVGWHALTLPQDPAQLAASRMDMIAVFLAVGLDPKRSIIFHQDHNPDHTELAWVLSCLTPMGQLRRMTTWKSRLSAAMGHTQQVEIEETSLHAGLFTYPVLQAADILVYKATHVPVGEDQTQHIELCSYLGDLFNRTFKDTSPVFPRPSILITTSKRILSLRDPNSKMSKSSPDIASRILLTDTHKEIEAKIRVAVTDSIAGITYDPINRPGTSNLLTILAACLDEDVLITTERYRDKNHGVLKKDVIEALEEMLKGPRAEFLRLRPEEGYLRVVAAQGGRRAREMSEKTMIEVRRRVGLS